MPKLKTDVAELHYEITGDGPPLLLIAGLSSDGQSWAPIKPILEKKFTLVMPDNRACGQTKDDGAAISIELMAQDAAALIDHLSLERVHVLGHSMGAAIAMTLTARRPECVGRLILAAGAIETPPFAASVIDTLLELRESGIDENTWYRLFFHWLFAPGFFDNKNAVDAAIAMSRAYPHAQNTTDMRRQIEAVRNFNAKALPPIINETLLLAAERDILIRPEVIARGETHLPNAQLQTLSEAGHSLHWDAPKAFTQAVIAYLEAP